MNNIQALSLSPFTSLQSVILDSARTVLNLTKSTGNSGSVFHGDEVCEWAGRSHREWYGVIYTREQISEFPCSDGQFQNAQYFGPSLSVHVNII